MIRVFVGIKELVTMAGAAMKSGRRIQETDLSIIRDGAIAEKDGKILAIGSRKAVQRAVRSRKVKVVDLKADCVLPAFIECHTHLVFAGDRKHEFEWRNQGLSYQDIAARGGGIRYTVEQTRRASRKGLAKLGEARAAEFARQGVTTVEVKSGYGLRLKDEAKILQAAGDIKSVRVMRTYLGPHAVPKDAAAEDYLNQIVEHDLPFIRKKKLAERVDIFVEDGYFTLEQARRYVARARALGFRVVGHVEQLTRTGAGVWLALEGADSADHLVQVNGEDIAAFAKSETTAVLLPTSDFYLRMKYPPAREFIDKGARVALATDFNPGTSPTQDLSLVGVLARLEMKMTLPEVISAYTVGAAHALHVQDRLGSLESDKICDFAVLSGSWRDLFYQVGRHPVQSVYKDGRLLIS